jgi:hypothetical protein
MKIGINASTADLPFTTSRGRCYTRRAVAAIVAVCILSFPAHSGRAQSQPVSAGGIEIKGWVEGASSVADVQVRLLDPSGREIGRAAETTGTTGTFRMAINSLPAEFTAEAAGGGLGQVKLLASVDAFNPATDFLHIDPATTLVARLLGPQPANAQAKIETEVDHCLGLPAYQQLEQTELEPEFTASLATMEKTDDGDLGTFLDQIEQRLRSDPNSTLRPSPGMAEPTVAAAAGASAPSPGSIARASTAALVKSLTTLLVKNYVGEWATGPAGAIVDPIFGWFLTAISGGDEKPDQIAEKLDRMDKKLDELSVQLTAIDGKVDSLKAQMGELFTQTIRSEYNTRVDNIGQGLAGEIQAASQKMKWLADNIRGKKIGEKNIRKDRDELLALGRSLEAKFSGSVICSALTKSGSGADPLLVVYSRLVRGSSRFWSQASARDVQNMFDYFDMLQLVQLEMVCEFGHAEERDQSWFEQRFDLYEKNRNAELAALRSAPPSDFQVIDSNTGLIWVTVPATSLKLPGLALNFKSIRTGGILDKNYFNPPTLDYGYPWQENFMTDKFMRLPTKDELDNLRETYAASNATDTTGRRLFFLDWLRRESGAMIWTPERVAEFLTEQAKPAITGGIRGPIPPSYFKISPPLSDQQWINAVAKVDKIYDAKSVLLKYADGSYGGLLIDHWDSQQITMWWSSSFEADKVMRAYNVWNNPNDKPMGRISNTVGGQGNAKPPRPEVATSVYVWRFDAGNARLIKDPVGRVLGRGYLEKTGYYGETPSGGYRDPDLGRDVRIDDREFQMIFPPDRYSADKRAPDSKYGPYFWSGGEDPWLGGVVILVRRLKPGEADQYYYSDKKS